MARNRIFTAIEIENVFRISESMPAPSNDRPGHAASRHIVLSNAELTQRYRQLDRDESMTLVTAFARGPDAIGAVTEAVNSPAGQQALQHLERDAVEGDRVTIQAFVAPFATRYAFGGENGQIRRASLRGVTAVLERREGTLAYGLHLVTAFPAVQFRNGVPGWGDRRGAWTNVP